VREVRRKFGEERDNVSHARWSGIIRGGNSHAGGTFTIVIKIEEGNSYFLLVVNLQVLGVRMGKRMKSGEH